MKDLTAADVMMALGVLTVAGAVASLTSLACGALWLGGALLVGGAVKAHGESGHVDLTTVLVVVIVVILVLILVGRL